MEKAKQEMQQQMQEADSNPMMALSNLREQAGGWQTDLNQCGIDTNAIMNELRPKLQEYMTKVSVTSGVEQRILRVSNDTKQIGSSNTIFKLLFYLMDWG